MLSATTIPQDLKVAGMGEATGRRFTGRLPDAYRTLMRSRAGPCPAAERRHGAGGCLRRSGVVRNEAHRGATVGEADAATAGVDGRARHRLLADPVQRHQHEGALAADQAVARREARLLGLVNVGGEGEIGVGRPAAVGRVNGPPAGAASAGTG